MEIILDTETTGLTRLSFANKLNYRQWPRMVQIAWALMENGRLIEQNSNIIHPEGFSIPQTATQIHGITNKQATTEGIEIRTALTELQSVFVKADQIIAHNLNFDLGIIESEAFRLKMPITVPEKRICTLHLGRKYLQREKGLRQGGYPKLGQLYETLFGFGYGPKHNASNDVTACYHIYSQLKRLGYT